MQVRQLAARMHRALEEYLNDKDAAKEHVQQGSASSIDFGK